jgi:hypothetical protein
MRRWKGEELVFALRCMGKYGDSRGVQEWNMVDVDEMTDAQEIVKLNVLRISLTIVLWIPTN